AVYVVLCVTTSEAGQPETVVARSGQFTWVLAVLVLSTGRGSPSSSLAVAVWEMVQNLLLPVAAAEQSAAFGAVTVIVKVGLAPLARLAVVHEICVHVLAAQFHPLGAVGIASVTPPVMESAKATFVAVSPLFETVTL